MAYGEHCASDVPDKLLAAFVQLQNGTDVRGVALPGVAGEPVTLTVLTTYFLGCAFVAWLSRRLDQDPEKVTVAVGTDSRLSALSLRTAFAAGASISGASVSDCGMATTPAMFFATLPPPEGLGYSGGVMVTASHLPFNRNGLKFFTAHGGLDKRDIRWILDEAAAACLRAGVAPGDHRHDPGHALHAALWGSSPEARDRDASAVMREYSASLRQAIQRAVAEGAEEGARLDADAPLRGMRILVNAGNGAGGFFAADVLAPLGADTSGSVHLDPDGTFPNHAPNPEDAAAVNTTIAAVRAAGADLGIVFDTDVDRCGVVDAGGGSINKNRLIALMAAVTLREAPGTTIVTDSVTSRGLTAFIDGLGGRHLRFKRGYKNVINKGIELNKAGERCELMIETSGHGALRENHFLDDGAYMSVKIIAEAARRRAEGRKDISELLAELEEAAESEEVRLRIRGDDWRTAAENVVSSFGEWVAGGGAPAWQIEEPNFEGVRVRVAASSEGGEETGWLLLRSSLHDPNLVVNVESEVAGGVKEALGKLRGFFRERDLEAAVDLGRLDDLL